MNRGWSVLGALVVGLATGACQSRAAAEPPPASSASTATSATNVLLFANLSEADEPCSCGDVIRAVRAAASRGVKAREVDTRNKDERSKVSQQYKIMVSPAVLFLDDAGKEVSRFEGESKETLEGVKSTLDKMAKPSGSFAPSAASAKQ